MKKSNKYLIVIIFICLLLIFLVSFSYARFRYNKLSNTDVDMAKWNVKFNDSNIYTNVIPLTLNIVDNDFVKEGKVAPNQILEATYKIIPEDTEVSFETSFLIPSNNKLYYKKDGNECTLENCSVNIDFYSAYYKFEEDENYVQINNINTLKKDNVDYLYPSNPIYVPYSKIENNKANLIVKIYFMISNDMVIGDSLISNNNSSDNVITYNKLNIKAYAMQKIDNASINDEIIDEINNKHRKIINTNYKQLDYIETTGTQYIKTGIIPNVNTKVEALYSPTSSSNGALIGSRTSLNDNSYIIWSAYSSKIGFSFGSQTVVLQNVEIDRWYKVIKDGYMNSADDTEFKNNNKINDLAANNRELYLFVLNSGGAKSNYAKAKLKYLSIYEDGTVLSRNFLPCIEVNTNTIGLYDTVNDAFYKNAGSGKFIASN